jgi:methylmalonyl-CoA mutase
MIDRGEEVIVGVNKYRKDNEDPIDILDIDNNKVREAQVARLEEIRSTRDEAACAAALAELERRAAEGGNLLEAAVEAARARASVGEISMAMEKVFGRHRAEVKTLAGVYGSAYEGDEGFAADPEADVEAFAEEEGRRPRMLVVKMGQDGHDRGAKVIATAFADIGFDVDVGPLFQTPEEAAQDAIDNDVHVVGISPGGGSQDAGAQADRGAAGRGRGRHHRDLRRRDPAPGLRVPEGRGVKAIFGPGTNIPSAARDILDLIRAARRPAAE